MLKLGKRLQLFHMIKHTVHHIRCVSLGPKKFLKVEGIHIKIGFITDAVAFDSLIVNTQKRTGTNNIKTAVNAEKL